MAAQASKYKTVMLIDDNEIDNLINQKMIEACSTADKILTHTGAKAAIESLKNLEKLGGSQSLLPEVIFLDIDMPLMDGFQFLEEFDKLSGDVKEHCRIVMLTSSMNPQDLTRAKKSPYVRKYINKPLSADTLTKLDV